MVREFLISIKNRIVPYLYEYGLVKRNPNKQCYFLIRKKKEEIRAFKSDTEKVLVVINGNRHEGEFNYIIGDYTWLELNVGGMVTVGKVGFDLFDALQRIRLVTELNGIVILCYGSRIDCHPSGMLRDMDSGQTCYLLTSDKFSKPQKVETLGVCEFANLGTVDQQNEFYKNWLGGS